MHILLIHQAFAALDEPGGTRHHELARYLADQNHRVSIITSPVSYLTGDDRSNSPITDDKNGFIRIFRTYTYPALHKSFFHRLVSFFSFMLSSFFKALSVKEVDLVWGTTPPIFQSFSSWLVSRIKGAPFLLEVRDLWPDFAIAVGVLKSPLLIHLSYWLERFLYRHADRIVVNSPGFVEHVENKGGKNIEIIPNGADVGLFEVMESQQARNILGWANKFTALYAGAHGMSNDLEVVLESAKELSINLEIQFIFVGDGKEKSSLAEKAKIMGLTNVHFLPPVSKKQIGLTLSAADVCIAILKPIDMYKTTYPNKVFDYMAAGKPVILAIDGVIREVIEEADCGIFCAPGDPYAIVDAIKFLYNNQSRSMQMGLNGRKYLEEHFDREQIAGKLAGLMEEMVNNG
jgi:glycosyltransferase involved in cell wall biosynthesis